MEPAAVEPVVVLPLALPLGLFVLLVLRLLGLPGLLLLSPLLILLLAISDCGCDCDCD